MTRNHRQIKQQLKWVYSYISCIIDQFEWPFSRNFVEAPQTFGWCTSGLIQFKKCGAGTKNR